jgi:hypothetical protein
MWLLSHENSAPYVSRWSLLKPKIDCRRAVGEQIVHHVILLKPKIVCRRAAGEQIVHHVISAFIMMTKKLNIFMKNENDALLFDIFLLFDIYINNNKGDTIIKELS